LEGFAVLQDGIKDLKLAREKFLREGEMSEPGY
jgi:hypothetical protein